MGAPHLQVASDLCCSAAATSSPPTNSGTLITSATCQNSQFGIRVGSHGLPTVGKPVPQIIPPFNTAITNNCFYNFMNIPSHTINMIWDFRCHQK